MSEISLAPLQQWYCDVCGEVIENPNDGYVIYKRDSEDGGYRDFKIIHQGRCDIRREYPYSGALSDFLGMDGLVNLTSLLSVGRIKNIQGQSSSKATNMDDFIDFFRRVQFKYYEEARTKFQNQNLLEDFSDDNELGPYLEERLRRIITEY